MSQTPDRAFPRPEKSPVPDAGTEDADKRERENPGNCIADGAEERFPNDSSSREPSAPANPAEEKQPPAAAAVPGYAPEILIALEP